MAHDRRHRRPGLLHVQPVEPDRSGTAAGLGSRASQATDQVTDLGVRPHPAWEPVEVRQRRRGGPVRPLTRDEAVHASGVGPLALDGHRVKPSSRINRSVMRDRSR
jgi:hypothetical protein